MESQGDRSLHGQHASNTSTACQDGVSGLACLPESSPDADGNFVARLSHEMRSPLHGILGYVELLRDTVISTEQREYLSGLKASSEALLHLIDELLDHSRLKSGRFELEKVSADLREIVENALLMVRPIARRKGLEIHVAIDDALPIRVLTDAFRFQQILLNLLSNAVKFSHKGAIRVGLSSVKAENGSYSLILTVEDEGVGIETDKHDLIFMDYAQAKASTARLYGGTGLGLSICRQLARMMGGDILVRSTVGQGSCFTCTLLVHEVPEGQCIVSFRKSRVLLADDNRMNQVVTRSFLTKLDLEVQTVGDGRAAVNAIQEKDFALVFLDLNMPEMNGREVARWIRSSVPFDQQPYIVALTAASGKDEKSACLDAGMDEVLVKPVGFAALKACLQRSQQKRG